MRDINKEINRVYKKQKMKDRLVPTVLSASIVIAGIFAYKDLSAQEVCAEQVSVVEAQPSKVDIVPVIGLTATQSSELAKQEDDTSDIDNTISKLEDLNNRYKERQEQLEEEKRKAQEEEAERRRKEEEARKSSSSSFFTDATDVYVAYPEISMGIKDYPDAVLGYSDMIKEYSEMFGVDPDVIASLISQESGGNKYCDTASSAGVAQIDACLEDDFVAFGRDYFGQEWTLDDRYLPAPSIAYCCYRISTYLKHYDGDYAKALQAYNYSHYSLDKLIDAFGDDWMAHTDEIAYYNGHYDRTGSTRYGDPNYVRNVLEFYQNIL